MKNNGCEKQKDDISFSYYNISQNYWFPSNFIWWDHNGIKIINGLYLIHWKTKTKQHVNNKYFHKIDNNRFKIIAHYKIIV